MQYSILKNYAKKRIIITVKRTKPKQQTEVPCMTRDEFLRSLLERSGYEVTDEADEDGYTVCRPAAED